MLEIQGISKSFAKPVLCDASAIFPAGEIALLMGDNGSGKSTLFKMILGLVEPDSGKIFFDRNMSSKQRARISLCNGANHGFYLRLSTRKNLQYFAALYGLAPRATAQKISELHAMGIDFWDEPLEACSAGMRAKANLARAFLSNPDLLLLDEALHSLDRNARKDAIAFVKNWLLERPQRLALIVQHELPLPGCKVWHIQAGKIQSCAP